MTTTALLLAWVLAGSPQPVNEYHINRHQIRIPISIAHGQQNEIRELILFVSNDEGKTWNQQAVASSDQAAFPFTAPRDGVYWFTVCVVNQQGERQPEDVYKAPPSQITKIVVDSLKPLVRIRSADRLGDDLVVNWEIQEDHPDLATLRLEYKPANAPDSQWTPASIQPQLLGQGRFRVANPGPLDLRMQMQDLAGNAGVGSFKVVAALNASTTQLASAEMSVPGPAPTPPAPAPPMGSSWDKLVQPASTSRPEPRLPPEPALPTPQPPVLTRTEPRPPVDRAPPPPMNPFQIPGAPLGDGKPPLVASSDKPPVAPAPPTALSPGSGTLGTLPPLQIINTRQVSIDYEVTKVGPSGIGKVELWVTRDDGRRWEKLAEGADLKPPLRVELPGEGAYGFRLLLQSKAGRHKPAPVSGDLPEMRLELDTTPPTANLYLPKPDPTQADALVLSWTASDRNLDAKPITLQWAEKAGGPWQTIVADWPNDGRYTWKLPPNIPFMVYLRLSAKDTAGNVSSAETPEPICIDLKEPEGHLLGISGKVVRRP